MLHGSASGQSTLLLGFNQAFLRYLVLQVSFALQDTRVIEMTQELAKMLGLKIRKAYVRSTVKKKKKKNWGVSTL